MWLKLKQFALALLLLNSAAAANDISQLDGDWYSFKWKYGYSLSNGKGVAFATNSPNFKVGQEIVRLAAVGENSFVGENVYKDGKFHKVKATLDPDGKLLFEGEKNVKWEMERIDPETYSSIVNSKPEKQAGNFSLNKDQCIILVASTKSETEAQALAKKYPGSELYTSKSGYIAVGLEKISKQQSAARIKELLNAGKIPNGSNCADDSRITGLLSDGKSSEQNTLKDTLTATPPSTASENSNVDISKSNSDSVVSEVKENIPEKDKERSGEKVAGGGMGSFSIYHWIIFIVIVALIFGVILIIKKLSSNSSKKGKPMSAGKFLFIYLIFMFPTYVWRWIFAAGAIGAAMDDSKSSDAAISAMGTTTYVLLAISYAVMMYAAYRRGSANNRKFLIAFPAVGGVFDIVLGFIPFVPTIFNILAIVFGSMSKAKAEEVEESES